MTTTSTRKKEKEKSRSSQRKSSRRSNRERRNNNGTECLIAITAVALVLFLLGQLLIMLFGGTPSIRLHSSAVVRQRCTASRPPAAALKASSRPTTLADQ